jgi:hypothetical protein
MILSLRERQSRRFLKVNRPIYSPALKANMPIFEAVPHFIESSDIGKASLPAYWRLPAA